MADNISEDFYNVLKRTLNEPIEDFSLEISSDIIGKGYSGEIIPVTLINKKSKDKIFIAIKNQTNTIEVMGHLFNNEITFYKDIWPTLHTFYTKTTGKTLSFIPKCLGVSSKDSKTIAMENLKYSGYSLLDIYKTFDNAHLETIFKTYGVFHGISMAFKENDPEKFWKLSKGIEYNWQYFFQLDQSPVILATKYSAATAKAFFDEVEEAKIVNKLGEYEKKGLELVCEMLNRNPVQRVISHGDCHAFNMMFKYGENGQIEDMKLLDFQLVCLGSPVHDLSYCYYSSTNCFTDSQKYLKIYHLSLSNTLQEFGLNANEIYSYDTFLAEWKDQCKFGFLMGLMLWKLKLSAPNSKLMVVEDNKLIPWDTAEDKKDDLKEAMRNLVLHMFNNDFL